LGYNQTSTNLTLFVREKKGKGFSLTSVHVPICPADGAYVKNTCEIKIPGFPGIKETDNDQCSVL
jgi:hypothetical protein